MTRALLMIAFLNVIAVAQAPVTKAKSLEPEDIDPNSWQARKLDGTILKIIVTTNTFTITTKYGTAKVPGKDVKRLEIGVRVGDADKKKILEALAQLESPQSKVREAAKSELLLLGGKAYPFAKKFWNTSGPAASAQLFHLLDQLKPTGSDPEVDLRDEDVLYTTDGSVFAGKLELEQLQATVDGRAVELARRDLSLVVHGGSADGSEKIEVVTSLGNLWATHLGKTVAIEVTAATCGVATPIHRTPTSTPRSFTPGCSSKAKRRSSKSGFRPTPARTRAAPPTALPAATTARGRAATRSWARPRSGSPHGNAWPRQSRNVPS